MTYDRIAPSVSADRIVVIAGSEQAGWVRRQVPELPRQNLILEERGRNTTASVALGALWITRRHKDAVMAVLPADHLIRPARALRRTLSHCAEAVRRSGGLVTIGVPATRPETGFGYIKAGKNEVFPGVARVSRFVEKPSISSARRLVRAGCYLWNSGIFVWRASTILSELRRHAPRVLRPLERWVHRSSSRAWTLPSGTMRGVATIPIDRGVLEVSNQVRVARASFGWSDLGSWAAFADLMEKHHSGNASIGRLKALGSSGCLAVNEGGLTVLIGLKDTVVVRSAGVVLVCHRDAAQQVRTVVSGLRGSLAPYR